MAAKETAASSDDVDREKAKNFVIPVNGPEDTAYSAATSGDGVREEEVNSLTILVSTPEETASSARIPFRWNFNTWAEGIKDAVCSAWIGLTCYCAALLQRWNDKIVIHPVRRWIVAFSLEAVYLFRAVYVGGLSFITISTGIMLLLHFAEFLFPKNYSLKQPLPAYSSDEFKPYIRQLPEFEFWLFYMFIRSLALVASFFLRVEGNDFPWYVQVAVLAFVGYFFLRRPLKYLKKYKYFPFNSWNQSSITGKQCKKHSEIAIAQEHCKREAPESS